MSTPRPEHRNLQSILDFDKRQILNRNDLIYEIHYRVPRPLSAPFMASHFVQIRQSAEDRYFDGAVAAVKVKFAPDDSLFVRDSKLSDVGPESDVSDRFATIRHYYTRVLEEHPALFVFGAQDYILDWIARRVTDEYGIDRTLDRVFRKFSERFRSRYEQRLDEILLSKELDPRTYGDYNSEDFGSVRFFLSDKGYLKKTSSGTTRFDDFVHYKIDADRARDERRPWQSRAINPLKPSSDLELRWSRFPQSWNYTFIESIPIVDERDRPRLQDVGERRALLTRFLFTAVVDPSVVNSDGFPEKIPDGKFFPGKTLAGAHYLLLRIDDLLAFALASPQMLGLGENTFTTETMLERILELRLGRPPDFRLRINRVANALRHGREDCLNSVKLLLATCFDLLGPRRVKTLVAKNRFGAVSVGVWARISGGVETLTQAVGEARPDAATELAEKLVEALRSDDTLLFPRDTGTRPSGEATEQSLLGDIVRAVATSTRISGERRALVFRRLADVTKAFWKSTIWAAIDDGELTHVVNDDFVSSAMSEGRCLYFSNFLPFGDEKFTRTIFVDIGMERHQRARMLQRLTDILSFRSIPIRDLGRVRDATDALNDVNRILNDIQMEITNQDGQTEGGDAPSSGRGEPRTRSQQIDALRAQLGKILRTSERLGRLNAFFTYGIAGKWASTSAYYEQILERCEDVREQRIPGYPRLTDFVRRRLKHSVRYIERLQVHHLTVGRRVTELLDRVRTQLDLLQTQQAADHTEETRKLTAEMAELTGRMADSTDTTAGLTGKMAELTKEQVSLTEAAEIVVLAAGLYYVFNLLKAWMESGWAAVVLVGAAILLALHPNYRKIFRRSIWERLQWLFGGRNRRDRK